MEEENEEKAILPLYNTATQLYGLLSTVTTTALAFRAKKKEKYITKRKKYTFYVVQILLIISIKKCNFFSAS